MQSWDGFCHEGSSHCFRRHSNLSLFRASPLCVLQIPLFKVFLPTMHDWQGRRDGVTSGHRASQAPFLSVQGVYILSHSSSPLHPSTGRCREPVTAVWSLVTTQWKLEQQKTTPTFAVSVNAKSRHSVTWGAGPSPNPTPAHCQHVHPFLLPWHSSFHEDAVVKRGEIHGWILSSRQ